MNEVFLGQSEGFGGGGHFYPGALSAQWHVTRNDTKCDHTPVSALDHRYSPPQTRYFNHSPYLSTKHVAILAGNGVCVYACCVPLNCKDCQCAVRVLELLRSLGRS